MTSRWLNDQSFDDLIRNAVDITDTFDIDLGGLPEDILEATEAVVPYLNSLRADMLRFTISPRADLSTVRFGLIDMVQWTETHGAAVERALTEGNVMAVDGTPLIHPQRYLTEQIYAIAIGGLTSRNPIDLVAKLVKVQAKFEEDEPTLDDVARLVEESEELTETPSWPNAFRDYQERVFALNSVHQYVIVDGPLIPQDVLTRNAGIQLFREMFMPAGRKCYVGVIKDIKRSASALRFHARALKTGELYVFDTLDNLLGQRIGTRYRGKVRDFIDTTGRHIFRGVYKPGLKAFAFECHRDDLPAVVSLLWLDRNKQPGYELPFLLAQVDAQIRGRYRPSETMAAIESTLARQDIEQFFDELDERALR